MWTTLDNSVYKYYSKSSKEIFGIPLFIKNIFNISRKYRLELAFSSHTHINFLFGLLRFLRILRVDKLVVRESTTILTRFKGWKLALFKLQYITGYWFNDLVVCQTDRIYTELEEYLPFSKRWNKQIIQNPIYIEKLNLEAKNIVDNFDVPTKYVIAAGRLIKEKGFDILIEAFAKIIKEKPDLKLLILGEGPERYQLESRIESLNLTARIKLLGFKNNPFPYFNMADLGVISSLVEGFPNVLLQMMVLNDRVVSTNCTGNIHEIEGLFVCEPGNVEQLAEKMDLALSMKDTKDIRIKFNRFLAENTVENYVAKIEKYLAEA